MQIERFLDNGVTPVNVDSSTILVHVNLPLTPYCMKEDIVPDKSLWQFAVAVFGFFSVIKTVGYLKLFVSSARSWCYPACSCHYDGQTSFYNEGLSLTSSRDVTSPLPNEGPVGAQTCHVLNCASLCGPRCRRTRPETSGGPVPQAGFTSAAAVQLDVTSPSPASAGTTSTEV